MSSTIWFWILFNGIVIILLIADLFIFHRKSAVVNIKESLAMCGFWVSLALLFNIGIYWFRGKEDALNFLTGYLIELSLSMDNLFIFLMVFTYFQVPKHLIHKTLFWGVLGAIVMRAAFILTGVALVQSFHWIIYLFGAFLIYSGIYLAFQKEKKEDLKNSLAVRIFTRFFPVTHHYEEDKFFIKKNGKTYATPLFLVLLSIESADIVFSIDSIPAIFGITLDPFIVYTSNIFAILGLRTMYFAVSQFVNLFHYLHYGLAFILIFIGSKMLIESWVQIPVVISLGVIAITLALSFAASIAFPLSKQR